MVEYNEIRDYIFEKYGKRVSNKWIAEIKREQGMLQFYVEGEVGAGQLRKFLKPDIAESPPFRLD